MAKDDEVINEMKKDIQSDNPTLNLKQGDVSFVKMLSAILRAYPSYLKDKWAEKRKTKADNRKETAKIWKRVGSKLNLFSYFKNKINKKYSTIAKGVDKNKVNPKDPAKPGVDPAKPGTDPAKPGTDPAKPGTDPTDVYSDEKINVLRNLIDTIIAKIKETLGQISVEFNKGTNANLAVIDELYEKYMALNIKLSEKEKELSQLIKDSKIKKDPIKVDPTKVDPTKVDPKVNPYEGKLIPGTQIAIPRAKMTGESIPEYETYLKTHYQKYGMVQPVEFYPGTSIEKPRLYYPHEMIKYTDHGMVIDGIYRDPYYDEMLKVYEYNARIQVENQKNGTQALVPINLFDPIKFDPTRWDPTKPVIKPGDPAIKPGDPVIKPGDPAIKPGDPAIKPGDPVIKPGDPAIKPGDPVIKPGDLVIKPGDPVVDSTKKTTAVFKGVTLNINGIQSVVLVKDTIAKNVSISSIQRISNNATRIIIKSKANALYSVTLRTLKDAKAALAKAKEEVQMSSLSDGTTELTIPDNSGFEITIEDPIRISR